MKNNNIEYKMSKKMFDAFLAARTAEEKKENPYTYVMRVLNQDFGLKGTVKHVLIYNY